MKQPRRMRIRTVIVATALTALTASASVYAELLERRMRVAGTTVHYKVVLPDGYDAARAWPAILVFGGGPQTMEVIDSTLERNFRALAETRGYIVVAPAAPDGELFFRGGARIMPDFLDAVSQEYAIENGKFHVAGPSNGGIAAFHVAALSPQYFLSVTAFPGYMWEPTTAKLDAISELCVFAYIGENDRYRWHEEMQREVEYLNSLGTLARYSLEAGQSHRLTSLADAQAARLFDNFELAATNDCRH